MGGHVFEKSSPIAKENIKPTLARFFAELMRIFPDIEDDLENNTATLGSTGKKPVSGDIDLCLDEKAIKNPEKWGLDKTTIDDYFFKFERRARTASKAQLRKRAILAAIAEKISENTEKIKVDDKGTGNGSLFFQFPQFGPKGEFIGKSVQIDLNVGDPDLLKFMYYSEGYKDKNLKGLHRTQLIIALFAEKGYTVGHNYGVKNKETNEIVANKPDQIINLLDQLYDFKIPDDGTINDFEKLYGFLEKNVRKEELNKVLDRYLGILDKTRCDVPHCLENYWLDNQERLDLSGKFLPSDSKLYPFRTE